MRKVRHLYIEVIVTQLCLCEDVNQGLKSVNINFESKFLSFFSMPSFIFTMLCYLVAIAGCSGSISVFNQNLSVKIDSIAGHAFCVNRIKQSTYINEFFKYVLPSTHPLCAYTLVIKDPETFCIKYELIKKIKINTDFTIIKHYYKSYNQYHIQSQFYQRQKIIFKL